MSIATSREVVEDFLRLTAQGPTETMADLFSEDAVFEMPYLPPGAPRQEPGREEFRAHLWHGAVLQKFDSVDEVRIHETADPEVVISEYRLHGQVRPTGKRFAYDMVMIVRVRDALIVWSRTYSNPLDGAIAFGTAGDLLTGLAGA